MDKHAVRQARIRADAARAVFLDTVNDMRHRLDPDRVRANLRSDVADRVKDAADTARRFVHDRPLIVGAIVGLIITTLFWRPISWIAHSIGRGAQTTAHRFAQWRTDREQDD